MENFQITKWCHHFIEDHVKRGDVCVDATAGNGNDTEFLARLVGEEGKVYAFDIQKTALENTEKRLYNAGLLERTVRILDGHEKMAKYVREEVSCIVFNFGYLPGGDHALATKAKTSICAIEESLKLLKRKGLLSLCIYSGGDTGFEERDEILNYLKQLDSKKYLVIVSEYYNRPNHPPIPAMILKN